MAGNVKTNSVQLGDSATATQNFVLRTNVDGTATLARGNVGATTQDVLTVNAAGATALRGTATNDNAEAGFVGEYVESSIPSGSAISLAGGASANVTSISLTAGDWEVGGVVAFLPAGGTSFSLLAGSTSTVSATFPTPPEGFRVGSAAQVAGALLMSHAVPTRRLSLSATTTIYLVASAVFTVSTMVAYGRISARRVR